VEPRELFFVDFETFKSTNPEVRILNRELQHLRFDFYEKLRTNTIKAVQDERNRIINNSLSGTETKFSKSKFSEITANLQSNSRLNKIKEAEKKQIDKIKQRQKMEIQTMIEFEINQEI